MENIEENIIDFLNTKYEKSAHTETIADEFNLTNRQVGSIMGRMKSKGIVRTYTKGTIILTDFMTRKPVPMRLSNSYYELLQDYLK